MFCGGMELRLHLKLFKDDTTFLDVCGTCGYFGDARGRQCSFVLCLHPQGCLRSVVRASGSPQVRTGKSGSFSMLHHPRGYVLNFLVTGLILRRAGKSGNPFQTKQGNRPSFRDQEERRGSDEVVPGTSVFPLSETGKSGNFSSCIKGAKYRFVLQDGTWDFS